MTVLCNDVFILTESRSSSACSGTGLSALPSTIPSSFQSNPLFMKFLMSQRQSDLSSVGGFSNVESGSQPDVDNSSQRRNSLNSDLSEAVSTAEDNVVRNSGALFSKSLDVLSGSTETINSSQSFSKKERNTPVNSPQESAEFKSGRKDIDDEIVARESINLTNSISLLNKPLDKVGFVTLDALMKGDTDIGKLLNKSLESIGKGIIPEGASPLHKQTSNDSQMSVQSGERQPERVRERRDSSFSISSDGGSDSEKRKVSMKYMGTLPGGMNYDAFVKQMSQENKNKSVMFTVLSSPEMSSQLRRTPDSAMKVPQFQKPLDSTIVQECGDTGSTKTLTDINDVESQSARSDVESQSARSTFSLGEQIKRMCEGQGLEDEQNLDLQTPRTGTDTFDEVTPRPTNLETNCDNYTKYEGTLLTKLRQSPVKECSVMLRDISPSKKTEDFISPTKPDSPKTVIQEAGSPVRKRLKSKKERNQMSRRKQKESFILVSDTNSDSENVSMGSGRGRPTLRATTCSEEEIVLSGSEDVTPRPSMLDRQKSLLDEVQLETPSDSCEDKSHRDTSFRMMATTDNRDV